MSFFYAAVLSNIEKELSSINKNLQSINKLMEKQSDDDVAIRDDILSICRDCPYYFHKKGDVRFCVHFNSCWRAYRLLTKENKD